MGGVSTTESGPSLLGLLTFAGVQFNSACKNDELRWWVEATNPKGQAVVITAGELDPLFGNRPAILSISQNGQFLTQNGPTLVVPNDSGGRDLKNVSIITVGRAPVELGDTATPACGTTSLLPTPPAGTVVVNGDVKTPLTLTMAQLAAMPQESQTDNFLQGTTPNTNTETGPTLYSIVMQAQPKFLACSPNDKARFYVEVTSSEDGLSTITAWDEIDPSADNVQDLMSLVEQRHAGVDDRHRPAFDGAGRRARRALRLRRRRDHRLPGSHRGADPSLRRLEEVAGATRFGLPRVEGAAARTGRASRR